MGVFRRGVIEFVMISYDPKEANTLKAILALLLI